MLASGAVWRTALAIRHYRRSLAITDDPSARELEQVTAVFESGLVVLLLAHAVAALYFTRHRLRPHAATVVLTAALAGTLTAASFWRAPVLGTPGLIPLSLLFACGVVGYRVAAPWSSAYLGVLVGSVVGFLVAAPGMDLTGMLVVVSFPVLFSLVGVTLGRLVRRARGMAVAA